ncbi:MAG: DUF1127 domain-containing protein [Silicimonas sp.]|nr:DUF1127 domain-containing protein [Silicimonas sp.]NND19796.1 DUF1127 domain-containing protein [Silicimonas sp.]
MYNDTFDRPVGHALHRLTEALEKRAKTIRRRRQFKTLLDLDDHILDDIGVFRHEVERSARLPLSVDAATELRRISLERRRRRM